MEESQLLRGRLEDVHFPEVLLAIFQRKGTGVLHLARAFVECDLYFQDGRIVFAKSNDADQRLGELLLRKGKVTCRQLDESSKKIAPGVRLGTILVQEGFLKANELYQGVIEQVEEIVYSLFDWTEGTFEFHSGDLPSKEVITLSIPTPDVIMAGISRIWRWSWVREGIGDLDTVYCRKEDWAAIAKKMSMTPVTQELIESVEQPRSLEEILNRSRIHDFDTCRLLWAFYIIGLIERAPAAVAMEEPAAQIPVYHVVSPEEEAVATTSIEGTMEMLQPEITSDIFGSGSFDSELLRNQETAPASSNSGGVSFSDISDATDSVEPPVAQVPREPAVAQWEADVEKNVQQFNEIHRYVFERLRIEMGSGVSNFLGKLIKKASAQYPFVFEGVELNEFGEFNREALSANILGNLAESYQEAFEFLLSDERESAALFLDKRKLEAIESGLARLREKQKKIDEHGS